MSKTSINSKIQKFGRRPLRIFLFEVVVGTTMWPPLSLYSIFRILHSSFEVMDVST